MIALEWQNIVDEELPCRCGTHAQPAHGAAATRSLVVRRDGLVIAHLVNACDNHVDIINSARVRSDQDSAQ